MAASSSFQVGDIVYHKTNPDQKLVVTTLGLNAGYHECKWFSIIQPLTNGTNSYYGKEHFHESELLKAKD